MSSYCFKRDEQNFSYFLDVEVLKLEETSTKLVCHCCHQRCTVFLPSVVHQACPTLSYKTTPTLRALQRCLSLTYPVLSPMLPLILLTHINTHTYSCMHKHTHIIFVSSLVKLTNNMFQSLICRT